MRNFGLLLSAALLLLAPAAFAADSTPVVITSAASTKAGVAPDSLASIFGSDLATVTQPAGAPPWPTQLGDISVVWITDAAGNKQMASLLFVSPAQMNIYLPAGLATGLATVQFPFTGLPPGVGTAALRTVPVNIARVAPAIFSADGTGTGVAAATAVRLLLPTQIQSPVPVFFCNTGGGCSPIAIDPGVDAPVYLSFYGTGIRGASSLSNVKVTIGSTSVSPSYAGPQPQIPGLDQVNVQLPLALRGAGNVDVTITVDGIASNPVQIRVQ